MNLPTTTGNLDVQSVTMSGSVSQKTEEHIASTLSAGESGTSQAPNSTSEPSIPSSPPAPSFGMSTSTIAGVAGGVGGVGGAILVVTLVVGTVLIRRRRRNKATSNADSTQTVDGSHDSTMFTPVSPGIEWKGELHGEHIQHDKKEKSGFHSKGKSDVAELQ